MMIAADLLRAAALATLPIAYWLGGLTIWQLFAVTFAVGALTVCFDLASVNFVIAPVIYLAAFLSGVRPARWWGTRLLPLVGGGVLYMILANVDWWWPVGFPLGIASVALFVAGIDYAVRVRDYG